MLATISGSVTVDTNGNGGSGGQPVPSAVVWCDNNLNGLVDAGEPSGTSSLSGAYSITGLSAGTYVLRCKTPAGYFLSSPADQMLIVTLSSSSVSVTNQNWGAWTVGVYGLNLYRDLNENGLKDSSEFTYTGRTLWADLDHDGVMDANEPATGTSQGGFIGLKLKPGAYTLQMNKPSEWHFTSPVGGAVSATITAGNANLPPNWGQNGPDIADGFVFTDVNGDDRFGPGDTPLAGVTAVVDSNGSGFQDPGEPSMQTGADGRFRFLGPFAGFADIYTVDSAGRGTFFPGSGENFFTRPVRPPSMASLSGVIFADLDGNGTRGSTEPALAGRVVYVDLNDNGGLDSGEPQTLTDGFGQFVIGAAPGTRHVRTLAGDDYVFGANGGAYAPTNVSNTGAFALGNLGMLDNRPTRGRCVIAGFAFQDDNRDGRRQDTEAGQPGVTVYADANNNNILDATERSAVSDATGFYAITELATNGAYRLRQIPPPGIENAQIGNGNNSEAPQTSFGSTPSVATLNVGSRVVGATVSGAFDLTTGRAALLNFSRDVSTTFGIGDVLLFNYGTNSFMGPVGWTVSQSLVGGNTIGKVNLGAGLLDGNYRVVLRAGAVADAGATALASDFSYDFFVFAADANHDRSVDLTDFTILAANFNSTGRTFAQGDFDGNGTVDLTDFTILASQFNKTLPPPPPAPAPAAALAATTAAPLSIAAAPAPAAPQPAADGDAEATRSIDDLLSAPVE